MRAYILSETEYQALLLDLEITKFKTPDQFALTEEQRKAQTDAVEWIHRKFHYTVCRHIAG